MITSKHLLSATFSIMIHVAAFRNRFSSTQVMAFSTLTSTQLHQFRIPSIRSFSGHKSVVNEDERTVSMEEEHAEKQELKFSKKYVFIRKNRQSMAFRNGSPLVFSGSVERTIDVGGNSEKKDEHNLEMGSLVGIVVSHENDSSQRKKPNSRFKGKRGGKQGKQATEVKYNHDLIDVMNNKVHSYSMDGSFLSSTDGIKDAQSAISNGKLIGFGFFNPVSMYRVFIFCHQTVHPELFKSIREIIKEDNSEIETTEKVLELVLHSKVKDAINARMLQGLPSESTDSYRLINGEGDGLSGLAIDILGGNAAVIMASAAWCELYRETILRVVEVIMNSEHPIYSKDDSSNLQIVWRNTPMRLKQDGYLIHPDDNNDHKSDEEAKPVIVTENSIKYKTYPFDTTSQKTGFYCDQRENRLKLAQLCEGKRVLDLCCYNGGFALNAMIHGGAASCVGVDSSPVAIAAANENKELNNVSSSLSFVQMDIAKYMNEAYENGEEFDVIIFDPPKLAPTIAQLERASRKYHSLNRDAMKLINKEKGGLLMTCTCSGAMTQKNGGQYFLETINCAALSAGRRVKLLSTSGAAPCHTQDPASFPANAYLTAALFSQQVLSFVPNTQSFRLKRSNRKSISTSLLSNEYLENDLVSIRMPETIKAKLNDNTKSDQYNEISSILCVVRPDGGIHPLCTHEDDNENDLFIHPKIAYLPWTDEEINDNDVVTIYGEGWYGQRVVPSLGGGPGYGAEADDIWTVDEDILTQIRDDNVLIPVLDLGIAHGEKARGGAI